jgi:BA14K-like protein
MKKSALAAVAAVLLSVMAPLPAEAQYRHGFNNWDGDRNHGYVNRWSGNRYYNRYRPFYGGLGFGLGAGIFGFALGSALANSYSNSYRVYGGYDDHVARCEARFRSYDASTDMYLGYDGYYHRCRL